MFDKKQIEANYFLTKVIPWHEGIFISITLEEKQVLVFGNVCFRTQNVLDVNATSSKNIETVNYIQK